MLEFEWDEEKAELNLQKHGVAFTEAASVFGDDLSVTSYDPKHSDDEDRFLTMGMSVGGRILIVSHRPRRPNSYHQRAGRNPPRKESL